MSNLVVVWSYEYYYLMINANITVFIGVNKWQFFFCGGRGIPMKEVSSVISDFVSMETPITFTDYQRVGGLGL